jgi:hypothetical protein
MHQAQQRAMRKAQEGSVVDLAPSDLALVTFGHNGQRGGEGAFIDFRRFVTQRQRPEPVGD